jgi:large subunit ribosomal protein L29
MKTSDLRGKTPAELEGLILEKRRDQFNARMQRGSGQDQRPNLVREARRDIARIKTILTEKSRSA